MSARLVIGDEVMANGVRGRVLTVESDRVRVRWAPPPHIAPSRDEWTVAALVLRVGPEHGDAIVAEIARCVDVLTGEEVQRIAAELPRVAEEWRAMRGGRFRHCHWEADSRRAGYAAAVRPPTSDDATWTAWVDSDHPDVPFTTEHATEAEALVSCDTRLRAMGIALCGEVHS